MTWPTSSAAVAAGVITAANTNAIRADLAAINGYVAKTADQSVTSSTTLVNDTHLLYSISNTGTYIIDAWLYATSAANAAGDLQVAFSFPTGTLHLSGVGPDAGLASGSVQTGQWGAALSATSGVTAAQVGLSTSLVLVQMHAVFTATATGTLRIMWAQLASNANASTLKAGSHMRVVQVA